MKIIDHIEQKLTQYKEHFDKIEENFNKHNEQFKALMKTDHDIIGKVLKCHLILENYINNYLKHKFKNLKIDNARLTFNQKINLLPDDDLRVEFVRNGIIELNGIRNKFSHRLNANIPIGNYNHMKEVLSVARKGKEYEKEIEIVEDFTTVACTFLIVDPEEIDLLFHEVFKTIQQ